METRSVGAFCFGFLIGWNLYYVNRYRADKVGLADLVALVGAIGGAAILALFPAKTTLFAWYSIGLLAGFLVYFLLVLVMVLLSKRFTVDFLLDGRGPKLRDTERDSGQRPLGPPDVERK